MEALIVGFVGMLVGVVFGWIVSRKRVDEIPDTAPTLKETRDAIREAQEAGTDAEIAAVEPAERNRDKSRRERWEDL